MEKVKQILDSNDYPTSEDLIALCCHDSNFLKTTRFLSTKGVDFKVAAQSFQDCTWAFTSIETQFISIAEKCRDLSKIHDGKRIQCNAYYTPKNTQGLPAHYDLHDVYVYQIEGSKQWHTWPAFRKQVSKETLLFDEKENLPQWVIGVAPTPQVLHQNDLLILKAGVPHMAWASSENSLHLSFGVYND